MYFSNYVGGANPFLHLEKTTVLQEVGPCYHCVHITQKACDSSRF